MNKTLALLFLFFLSLTTHAQNFNFGVTSPEDYEFDRKKIDSNANAVVLREFGKGFFEMNFEGHTDVAFIYHVKIKIYNRAGFDQANIIIPMYKGEFRDETISDLKASTFNLIDGKITETQLDKEKLIVENQSKNLNLAKFTLPNIKEGSVIDIPTNSCRQMYLTLKHGHSSLKYLRFTASLSPLYLQFIRIIPHLEAT